MTKGQMRDQGPAAEPDGFAAALAAEIATLRAAGFSKAYICERSAEIEARVRDRLARDLTAPDQPATDLSDRNPSGEG